MIDGKLPYWCDEEEKWLRWYNEALIHREWGYNTEEMNEMVEDHFYFLLELIEEEQLLKKKLHDEAVRNAKKGKR